MRLIEDDGVPYSPRAMNADLLVGAKAIGEYVGISERWVRHLAKKGRLPVFHMGNTICGRRSTFNAWIADQERQNAVGARSS